MKTPSARALYFALLLAAFSRHVAGAPAALYGCAENFYREEIATSQRGVMTNIVVPDDDSSVERIVVRDVTVEFTFSEIFAPYGAPTVRVYMAKNGATFQEADENPNNWTLVGEVKNLQVSQTSTDVVALNLDLDFAIPAGAKQGIYVYATRRGIRAKNVDGRNGVFAEGAGAHFQGGAITINEEFKWPTPGYHPAIGVCFDVVPVPQIQDLGLQAAALVQNSALHHQNAVLAELVDELRLLRGAQAPIRTDDAPSALPVLNSNDTYPVLAGCPTAGASNVTECRRADELANVRCCRDNGGRSACISLCSGANGWDAVTLQEAIEECAALNMRLCTSEEIAAEVCCSTGCHYDTGRIWAAADESICAN